MINIDLFIFPDSLPGAADAKTWSVASSAIAVAQVPERAAACAAASRPMSAATVVHAAVAARTATSEGG